MRQSQMRMIRVFTTALILSCAAAGQSAAEQNKSAAPKEVPSFDLGALDTTTDPCVDFYQYSCGGWLKGNPIPPDQAAWGRFNELAERNRAFLRAILEDTAKDTKRTANEQKIGDYYASCMDEETINQKGIAAVKPELDRISGLKSKSELAPLIAYLHSRGVNVLFSFGSGADFKNAKEVIGQADQGGLSLPDRDYYLKDDPKMAETRKAYVQHVTNMFQLLGDTPEK